MGLKKNRYYLRRIEIRRYNIDRAYGTLIFNRTGRFTPTIIISGSIRISCFINFNIFTKMRTFKIHFLTMKLMGFFYIYASFLKKY
jgi:hypothetical protein